MSEHADIPIGEVHIVHQWVYADASARTGASGFVSADIGKVAKQTDNNSWWVLIATTPTWAELTGTGATTTFLGLVDVDPSSYSGETGRLVAVNQTPDGLEFIAGFAIDGSGDLNANDNLVIRPELIDYAESVNARGTVSGAQDIDLTLGNVAELTISAATTLSLTNPPASGSYGKVRIIFHQDGTGGHTLTLPTALWDSGSAPTPSTGIDDIDIYTFFTVDAGTTWYGIVDGQAMA